MGTAQACRGSSRAAKVATVSVDAAATAMSSPQRVPATKATKPIGTRYRLVATKS